MRSDELEPPKSKWLIRALRIVAWITAWLVVIVCAIWAAAALYFDLPAFGALVAGVFVLVLVVAIIFLRGVWRKIQGVLVGFALVLIWWLTLKPSNVRAWQPDVSQTAWAEIDGDTVTLHNVRNCDYRTETDYTPRWESRTVRLSQLTGIDLAINYWGSPWIAHPIVSFQFADAPPVCLSIETRKEIGESYSALRGFFRQFELVYVVADERDVVRLRTNLRRGEDVFLYRTTASPEHARERFLEYANSLNALRERPRWYNAVTTNCTTSIRAQHPESRRIPWDWRILANGKGDELMYERGTLDRSLPFPELKRRAHINERAMAAHDAPDFSERIRAPSPVPPSP